MNPERGRYIKNKRRVRQIENIPQDDRTCDTHHIVFRSDFADPKHPPKKMNGKGNLYVLDREQHEWIHHTVDKHGKITPEAHEELEGIID